MKIFWIVNADGGFHHRCFFKMSHALAQKEVDVRIEAEKEDREKGYPVWPGTWEIEEEEVEDAKFGYCINGLPDQSIPSFTLPTSPDCSVGMVRKIRNGVEDDDGTCGTCPYYSNTKP